MCPVLWNSFAFYESAFCCFSKFLSNAKAHICLCILFLSILHWPHIAVAFLLCLPKPCSSSGARLRQVSGGRKDLFSYFESPVSVGSQGKGWGGSTTHRTGLTTLMWPCSTPLLSHIMGLFLHLMSPSIGKNKTKNKYLNLVILNDFWYSTNLVITHSPLPHH